jgi:hypothetical protein
MTKTELRDTKPWTAAVTVIVDFEKPFALMEKDRPRLPGPTATATRN